MEANFLVQKLVQIQNPDISTENLDALSNSKELESFFQDMNQTMIFINLDDKISFSQDVKPASSQVFLVTKLKPSIITMENFGKLVRFVSIRDSILGELYQTIHSVYSPMLENGRPLVNTKVKSLIADLEIGLATSLQIGSADPSARENLALINSFEDEHAYWVREAANPSVEKIDRERAGFFRDGFAHLKRDFGRLSTMTFYDLLELIEKIHEAFDDIWRQQDFAGYPQERMKHLLGIVSEDLVACTQNILSPLALMADPLAQVLEPLKTAQQ
ncbi:Cytoplasmic dynein 2 heavy chain 1, partial [Kappamyces sp. JEL0680]